MVRRVPFKAWHLMGMVLQESQQWLYSVVGPEEARALEGPHAFTALNELGDPVACGGALTYWKGRGLLWAYLAVDARPHMTSITRGVRRLIEELPHTRLEAAVECDFAAGHRWARLLGLELETERARKYLENGADCSIYARIR